MPIGAQALVYPELTAPNARFYPLYDHTVHAQALVEAIDTAEPGDHIDFLYYLITADRRIGLPVIEALRRAANREVHVRVLTSDIANIYMDRSGWDIQLLTDKSLATPIQFTKFGGWRNWFHGLGFNDALHEKLVLIRGPAGVKVAFFGGRNLDHNETFLDLAFIVKPLNVTSSSLCDQLWQVFEDRWDTVQRLFQPLRLRRTAPRTAQIAAESHTSLSPKQVREIPSPEQVQDMDGVRRFMASAGVDAEPVPGELRPAAAQVITNEMLGNARTGIFSRTLLGRARMPDDIEFKAEEILLSEKMIYLMSMIASFSPRLMGALKIAMQDALLRIYSNGRKAARLVVPRGVSYMVSLSAFIDLFKTPYPRGNLEVRLMAPDARYNFMHLKGIYTPRLALLLTSNLNSQSVANNTEMAIVVNDPVFAQAMLEDITRRVEPLFHELDCETALSDYETESTLFRRVLNFFVSMFY